MPILPAQDTALSQDLLAYVRTQFTPNLQTTVEHSFTLLHAMGLRFYEDRFMQILSLQGMIDSEEVHLSFMAAMRATLSDVLDQHHIQVDADADIRLHELNELVGFLLLVQALEDTQLLAYRLGGFDEPRAIVVDLLSYYTLTSKMRWCEIVSGVRPGLISAMQALVRDNEASDDPRYTQPYLIGWKNFCEYTEGTDCLGKRLATVGLRAMPLEQLLEQAAVQTWVDSTDTVQPQRSLDLWSLLALSQDYQELPLLGLDKNATVLFPDIAQMSIAKATVSRMVADFADWCGAKRQSTLL